MRISDWSSDVCSSDLSAGDPAATADGRGRGEQVTPRSSNDSGRPYRCPTDPIGTSLWHANPRAGHQGRRRRRPTANLPRSEEHTSELQTLMRSSYAVFSPKNTTSFTIRRTHVGTTPI